MLYVGSRAVLHAGATMSLVNDEALPVVRGAIGELFWSISDAVIIHHEGRVLAWNPAAERVFGVTSQEATAPEFDLDAIFGSSAPELARLLADGGSGPLDARSGCGRELEATAWKLGDEPGGRSVVVLRDVTSDRRYLRGLEGLNILARELVSDLRLDELTQRIVDEAKRILDARFSALIALRPGSDVEIQHFAYNAPRELFPARLPRVVGLLAVPIQTRSAARLDDIRGHPAGVGIPVEHPPLASLLAVPIIAGDEVIGELAVANAPGDASFDEVDESLLRELASHAAIAMTLAASRRDRERAEEDRAALLGLALHNIRTPITIARGFVSTVRGHAESLTEPVREEAFNAIDRALERIHTLAEGALLQDWRPPEAPVRKAPTNLDEIVSGLFSDLESLSRSVELRYLPDPTLPQRPSLDVLLVREILHNLMTNAIQHSPEGEAVVLSARLEGPSIRFDVTDSGPGIPARQQARLFVEPPPLTTPGASGADPSSSHPLWNVKRIVDRMGGNVGVSSRPGEGSTFWFTVPVETG